MPLILKNYIFSVNYDYFLSKLSGLQNFVGCACSVYVLCFDFIIIRFFAKLQITISQILLLSIFYSSNDSVQSNRYSGQIQNLFGVWLQCMYHLSSVFHFWKDSLCIAIGITVRKLQENHHLLFLSLNLLPSTLPNCSFFLPFIVFCLDADLIYSYCPVLTLVLLWVTLVGRRQLWDFRSPIVVTINYSIKCL